MNNERRKALKVLRNQIDEIHRALSNFDIDEIKAGVEEHRDDEQSYYDNMPESFQDGDKGQAAQDAIEQLDGAIEALESLEEMLQNLENAVGCIETACGD